MHITKEKEDQNSYPGTHITLMSKQIGTMEICRQQHKIPFHKQNMIREHFLLFAVEGINNLRIGKQFFSLKKGDMLLIKKASYVEIIKEGESWNNYMYESVSIALKKEVIIDFIKLIEMDDYPKTPVNEEVAIHSYGERLQSFLLSLKPYFDDNEKIRTGLFKLKILELLYELVQQNPRFLWQLINLNRYETRDIMETLETYVFYPYTLQELAQISGRSLPSFRREFESLFQTTPAKWIQEKRLQKARDLLLSTKLTNANVCFEVGYENVSHFSRLYKKHFGYSPSETKKQ